MGWASGGEVFEPVAKALLNDLVPSQARFEACKALIEGLQGRGWDTEAESLGLFTDHPDIVAAFAACDVFLSDDEEDDD